MMDDTQEKALKMVSDLAKDLRVMFPKAQSIDICVLPEKVEFTPRFDIPKGLMDKGPE